MATIRLTSPVVYVDYDSVKLDHVGWHPERKEVSARFSLGFVDATGSWVERKDKHIVVKNIPATTAADGTVVPADLQYDNLMTEIDNKPVTVGIEQFILEKYGLAYFPGTIA